MMTDGEQRAMTIGLLVGVIGGVLIEIVSDRYWSVLVSAFWAGGR